MQALVLGVALIFAAGGAASAAENPFKIALEQRAFDEGFHCGKTFISVADVDEFLRTVRKADVVSIMAVVGQPLAAMFVHRKTEEDSFAIKFPDRYRKIIVECLD